MLFNSWSFDVESVILYKAPVEPSLKIFSVIVKRINFLVESFDFSTAVPFSNFSVVSFFIYVTS